MKNYIGYVRDHSLSMSTLTKGARQDYNLNISAIKEAAFAENQDTIISTVKCGVGVEGLVVKEHTLSSIAVLEPLHSYVANGRSTPLFDSVGVLVDEFKAVPDAAKQEVSFLVMVITDGENNSSKTWSGRTLGAEIERLQATDRWTFTFRVPRGKKRALVNLGIPEGNILEWDQTTEGIERATHVTTQAIKTYYSNRTAGISSTRTFYADLSKVSPAQLRGTMANIKGLVKFLPVRFPIAIKEFIESRTAYSYKKGEAFYQLTKTEKAVQDYKMLAIRDRLSGDVYSGDYARQLLGIPTYGTIKLAPGSFSQYELFIQSTSLNRKLEPNTTVMVWPNCSINK